MGLDAWFSYIWYRDKLCTCYFSSFSFTIFMLFWFDDCKFRFVTLRFCKCYLKMNYKREVDDLLCFVLMAPTAGLPWGLKKLLVQTKKNDDSFYRTEIPTNYNYWNKHMGLYLLLLKEWIRFYQYESVAIKRTNSI